MRALTDIERLRAFMKAIGAEASQETAVYFTGGACAVLLGWRANTIDVDIKLIPDRDEILRAIPRLKESLKINVELASPGDFIPPLPGWQSRSVYIGREGLVSFYHYDFYGQALAKIERGHPQDNSDVRDMIAQGFVDRAELLRLFEQIEPELYRYPAIDPASFRRAVEKMLAQCL